MLEEIFSKFARSMSERDFLQGVNKSIIRDRFASLSNQQKIEADLSEEQRGGHWRFLTYENAITGQAEGLGIVTLNTEDMIRETRNILNKQLCWALVSAYESYELFLKEVYAYLGKARPEFWPMQDFGAITLGELSSKDHAWFLTQAKSKKNSPYSILSQLRSKLDGLAVLEINNAHQLNYKFIIVMISKFRHLIVHNDGVVDDLGLLCDKILSECHCAKSEKERLTSSVKYYFTRSGGSFELSILDRYSSIGRAPKPYTNVAGLLMDYLVSHAHLVACAIEHTLNPSKEISDCMKIADDG